MEKPTTPPNNAINTKVRIELDFDMLKSNVRMASQSPTVVIMGVLARARRAKPTEIPERGLGTARKVVVEYDLSWPDDALPTVQSDASAMLYEGIIELAFSMVTQNQVTQRIQAMAQRQALNKMPAPGLPKA